MAGRPKGGGKSPRQVADEIRGQYARTAANVRVPDMTEIADDLGCSRATVALAFNILLKENFIRPHAGEGGPYRFSGFGPLPAEDITHAGVEGVLELRLCIEPGVAALAAARWKKLEPEGKLQFEHAYEELKREAEKKDGTVQAWLEADRAFHQAFHMLAGNTLVQTMLAQLSSAIAENVKDVVSDLFDSEYRKDTQRQHEAIYKAITSCDPKAALTATYLHLHDAYAAITRRILRR